MLFFNFPLFLLFFVFFLLLVSIHSFSLVEMDVEIGGVLGCEIVKLLYFYFIAVLYHLGTLVQNFCFSAYDFVFVCNIFCESHTQCIKHLPFLGFRKKVLIRLEPSVIFKNIKKQVLVVFIFIWESYSINIFLFIDKDFINF